VKLSNIFLMASTLLLSSKVLSMDYVQYFDLNNMKHDSNVSSNFINQKIKAVGGMDRVYNLASLHDDDSSYVLGYLYLKGHVYERNITKALEYLEPLKFKGPLSSFLLGTHLLDYDNEMGYDMETKKHGAELIAYAGTKGMVEAEYFAAYFYINGIYLVEDRDVAMTLLKSARSKGHIDATKSINSLENIYSLRDVDYDNIQKYAHEGHIDSIIKLSKLYYEGWRVSRDREKAFRLLELAVNKGSKDAMEIKRKWLSNH
jgi:TPR repeat protein